MTRRDSITVAITSIVALGAALVLGALFNPGVGDGPELQPLPYSALLPDPPAVTPRVPLLPVRLTQTNPFSPPADLPMRI